MAALKRAGAVVLGKANMHELALEGLTVSSLGGQTLNPFDRTRTPGGSSGGSAAAVALSLCVFATGSDTMNSLRSPASANSLCSIRPTRGLISRSGVVPLSETQDAIGPIARSVRDVAVALSVMARVGKDEADSATAHIPDSLIGRDFSASLDSSSLRGKHFGLLKGLCTSSEGDDLEERPVREALVDAVTKLRQAGALVSNVSDPVFCSQAILDRADTQTYEYAGLLDAYLSRADVEGNFPKTASQLYSTDEFLVIPAQYEKVRAALRSSTREVDYTRAKQEIRKLQAKLEETLQKGHFDALIYPEQTNLVVSLGSPSQRGRNGILAAVTGYPAVCVPMGFSPESESALDGVPIGLEILGRPWEEEKLLQIARQVEQLLAARRAPRISGRAVNARPMPSVPSVEPTNPSLPREYPVGRLTA